MEHTDSFTFRLLLVAKDEKKAKEIERHFTKAGLISMDVETGINNVIPKLSKNTDYDGIVLESQATSDVAMYLTKLKANRNGKKLPIVVLLNSEEGTWLDVTRMYDAGANFVISDSLDEDVANHICWIFNSLMTFTEQFKKGQERLYSK